VSARGARGGAGAAISEMAKLFPRAPFGVFAGRQGQVAFVGVVTATKRCLRFTGSTFNAALLSARRWRDDERNGWRMAEHGLTGEGS